MLDMVSKSICCILCRGSILYFDDTGMVKFGRHMQFEHGAMHDLDFMMAACKMNESEKKALVDVFNKVDTIEVNNSSDITSNSSKNADKENKAGPKTYVNDRSKDKKVSLVKEESKKVSKVIPKEATFLKREEKKDKIALNKSSLDKDNSSKKLKTEKQDGKCSDEKVLNNSDDKEDKTALEKKTHGVKPETKQPKISKESTSNKRVILAIKSKSKQFARYSSKVSKNNKEKSKTQSKCCHCEKLFKSEQKLVKHVERNHPNMKIKSKVYSCDECSLSFKRRRELNDHVKHLHVNAEVIEVKTVVISKSPEIKQEKNKFESKNIDFCISSLKRSPASEENGNYKKDIDAIFINSKLDSLDSSTKNELARKKVKILEDTDKSISDHTRSSKKQKVETETKVRDIEEQIGDKSKASKCEKKESIASGITSDCAICAEYSNNFSKLRRHQRYVHGIKGAEFKFVERTEEEIDNEFDEEPGVSLETGPIVKEVMHEEVDIFVTELKSCLKNSTSVSKKRSIRFNETIFYKEFNKEEAICSPEKDTKDILKDNTEVVEDSTETDGVSPVGKAYHSPRPVGRPKKKLPQSPPNTSPQLKKRKNDGEELSEPSRKKFRTDKRERNVVVDVDEDEDEFEANTALAIKLSLEPAKVDKNLTENKQEEMVIEETISVEIPTPVETSIMETIILHPCDPCGISFEHKKELSNHEEIFIHTTDETSVQSPESFDQQQTERGIQVNEKVMEETVTAAPAIIECMEDKIVDSETNATTNLIKPTQESETVTLYESFEVQDVCDPTDQTTTDEIIINDEPKKPEIVLKQEVLTEALLSESSDSGMVSLPMDSFLETILTEEPVAAKLHSAMDTFTANLKANSVKSSSLSTNIEGSLKPATSPNVVLPASLPPPGPVEVKTKTDGLLPLALMEKYKKLPKRIDFTQSNFFMKNVELIGKSVNGGGFKESNAFLPEGWKMKTFNEFKKFYLTPDYVVLKSPTAVIEFLRLSLDLSQDDLKSLAKHLKVVGKLFDRYLDELYDDCVLLE